MTLLPEATDVFAATESVGRCIVAFLARRQPLTGGAIGTSEKNGICEVLRTLQAEGWLMSGGPRSTPRL